MKKGFAQEVPRNNFEDTRGILICLLLICHIMLICPCLLNTSTNTQPLLPICVPFVSFFSVRLNNTSLITFAFEVSPLRVYYLWPLTWPVFILLRLSDTHFSLVSFLAPSSFCRSDNSSCLTLGYRRLDWLTMLIHQVSHKAIDWLLFAYKMLNLWDKYFWRS